MQQFIVTGMSCAACSARVEKAVSKVEGVTSCSVSLLTNSMGVEGTAADQAIIQAVEAAGYGASVKCEAADHSGESPSTAHRRDRRYPLWGFRRAGWTGSDSRPPSPAAAGTSSRR